MNAENELLKGALNNLEDAVKHGLGREVLAYALSQVKVSPEEFIKATWAGLCEWIK